VPHVTRRQARPPAPVRSLASHRTPPSLPGRAGSLSGRPFCRIYLEKQVWILELDSASGAWIGLANAGDRIGYPSGPSRLTFPTLSGAIGYAEYHGLDYRVIAPPRPRSKPTLKGGGRVHHIRRSTKSANWMSIGRDRRRDNEERIRLVAMARGDGLFPQPDLPGCDCRAMSNRVARFDYVMMPTARS
jgi:hypothetical protein